MPARILRLSLTLTLLACFFAEGAWALPTRMLAEIRAVACCTGHCPRPKALPDAARCCNLRSIESLLPASANPPLHPPVFAVLSAIVETAPRHIELAGATVLSPDRFRRGSPLFLLIRSLRI